MPYIIEKLVGKSTYLYQVKSFWDSKKKQPRQKRTYLGKKDPETGQPVRTRNKYTPRLSKDYGHVYLLQKLAEDIGLTQLLKNVFPDDHHILLALTFFEISEAAPLYIFPYWVASTMLEDVQPLSPKALTTFTEKMGRMDCERLEFSKHWVKQVGETHVVVFDITSLSSYSELFEYLEPGYNRDNEHLPQINLGVIYAEQNKIPLYYQVYPGSIPDVSTLKNLLNYLELFELTDILFVMDRGFYSAANLSNMNQTPIKFIIPLPRSVKLFSTLLSKHTKKLSNLENTFLFNDEVLFYVQESTKINQVPIQAHLYFDPRSRSEQTTRFLKKILELETSCKKETFHNKKEVLQYLSSHLKGASQCFKVTVKAGSPKITRKTKNLSKHMANMGITIMLTNHNGLGRETILDMYRQKDYLEKTFDVLKNEFDGKRLRGILKDTIEGRLFVKFISLILYSVIGNKMREQQLFKRYSVREIMYELKKIRIVEMTNGKSYLTEISKRQKEIFNKFGVETPNIET
jgi:transposase